MFHLWAASVTTRFSDQSVEIPVEDWHFPVSAIGGGLGQPGQENSRSAATTVLLVVGAGTAPGEDCRTITGQMSA